MSYSPPLAEAGGEFSRQLLQQSLAVFGAGDVAEYGKVFIFGVIVGTFSSIYIASPIFYWWHKGDRKRVEEGDKAYVYSWEAGNEKKK